MPTFGPVVLPQFPYSRSSLHHQSLFRITVRVQQLIICRHSTQLSSIYSRRQDYRHRLRNSPPTKPEEVEPGGSKSQSKPLNFTQQSTKRATSRKRLRMNYQLLLQSIATHSLTIAGDATTPSPTPGALTSAQPAAPKYKSYHALTSCGFRCYGSARRFPLAWRRDGRCQAPLSRNGCAFASTSCRLAIAASTCCWISVQREAKGGVLSVGGPRQKSAIF